jgi:hypothetical protein
VQPRITHEIAQQAETGVAPEKLRLALARVLDARPDRASGVRELCSSLLCGAKEMTRVVSFK